MPSNLYYPNKFGLLIIKALEEVSSINHTNAILNLAGLEHYIGRYPPDNFDKGFDFSEVSAICSALEYMHGPRGGWGIALRLGRAFSSHLFRNMAELGSVSDPFFVALPPDSKLRIGLPALTKIFTQWSDQQTTVEETDTSLIWTIHNCPVCWGRTSQSHVVCYMAVALLQDSLKWISTGEEFRVNETKCRAVGHQVCEFTIDKKPIS